MYNEIVELGKVKISNDDIGNQKKTYNFREVFADIRSISQNEFYTAAQSGFKPIFKVVLADYLDYDNEEVIKYNNKIYSIIRVYRNNLEIELTITQKIEGM